MRAIRGPSFIIVHSLLSMPVAEAAVAALRLHSARPGAAGHASAKWASAPEAPRTASLPAAFNVRKLILSKLLTLVAVTRAGCQARH